VEEAIGEPLVPSTPNEKRMLPPLRLGRFGGLKSGKARAAKLSKKKRIDIAKKVARARWETQSVPFTHLITTVTGLI
jgi:hypothetical protein